MTWNTGVRRTIQSGGLNAVLPWNSSNDATKFWMTANCSPLPKNPGVPGRAVEIAAGVGRSRTSTVVSLMSVITKNVFWPKTG